MVLALWLGTSGAACGPPEVEPGAGGGTVEVGDDDSAAAGDDGPRARGRDAEVDPEDEPDPGAAPGGAADPGADPPAEPPVVPEERPIDGCEPLASDGDFDCRIDLGGVDRAYLVHVPPEPPPPEGRSLVLDFHGYASTPWLQEQGTGMNAAADDHGFVAVHPDATGLDSGWNAGSCCGLSAIFGVDDVGFARAIVETVSDALAIAPGRVYATGLSNGGFFAHRLACEAADVFAAVASVAGKLGVPDCQPSRAIPILQIHGTADPIVPYGWLGLTGGPPVPDMMADWAERNGCDRDGERLETFAQGNTRCEAWQGCRDGATVELCTVDGGGHEWPHDPLSATDWIAAFFAAHEGP